MITALPFSALLQIVATLTAAYIGVSLATTPMRVDGAGERKAITKTTTVRTLTVASGNELVMQRGSRLIVDTLTVEKDGTISCERGPIDITVRKQLVVAGTLRCFRDTLAKNDIGNAILLTLEKSASAVFEDSALVAANGHVQIVDTRGRLVVNPKQLNTYRGAFTKDDGAPIGIGPFLPKNAAKPKVRKVKKVQLNAPPARCRDANGNIVPNCLRFGGAWVLGKSDETPPKQIVVPRPPKGIDRIFLNYDFGGKDVEFQNDQEITGPAGAPGKDDPAPGDKAKCIARGGNGGNAMDFKINARSVTFNNFLLKLGDGGYGGSATTDVCMKAVATGGTGGEAGNMHVRALAAIRVLGRFILLPGRGGDGGRAKAYGKKGDAGTTPPKSCAGGPGGTADATGGAGADSIRELRARGVDGFTNIMIYPLHAGDGGDALARGGDGGDGITMGGAGGAARARGGKGGVAKFTISGLNATTDADTQGKDGSSAASNGVQGAALGGSCNVKPVEDGGSKPPPKQDITSLKFEFVDYTSGATTQTLPRRSESGFEIILASKGTPDVTKLLPIRFVVLVDGQVKQERTISSSVQDCRDATGCSIYQPSLGDLTGKKVEIRAYDGKGTLLGEVM